METIRSSAQFVNKRRPEDMVVTQREQISRCRTEVPEPGQRGDQLQGRFGPAVAVGYEITKEVVSSRDTVIDSAGKLIEAAFARHAALKPVACIRLRDESEKFLDDGI